MQPLNESLTPKTAKNYCPEKLLEQLQAQQINNNLYTRVAPTDLAEFYTFFPPCLVYLNKTDNHKINNVAFP